MATITLRKVDSENYLAVLRLKVKPEQTGFVATNAASLAQSNFHDEAWCRCIYADDVPVGFVMLSIKPEEPEYFLWRFMIDAEYQGKGYGREGLRKVIEYVQANTDADEFSLSFKKGDGNPEGFYLKSGFAATGAVEDGEHIMTMALPRQPGRLENDAFPRSSQYNADWMLEGPFGGNAVWLAEWLTNDLKLEPGMRVLDLGCGRAKSSIFLAREFDVQVWATDIWINATENLQRIEAADESQRVFPLHADARALPFGACFFDAIVCLDSFPYFGTDNLFLNYLAQFVKPSGPIGIAGAAVMQEMDGTVPSHLEKLWDQSFHSLHSVAWWREHWAKTGIVDIELADTMDDGVAVWKQWHEAIGGGSNWFSDVLDEDAGRYLGYFRMIGRRNPAAKLEEHCWPDQSKSWPIQFTKLPVVRECD